jgi:predicted phage-related endonuclease
MKKLIEFRCEEELKEITEVLSNDIKNGFGAVIIPKPPTHYRRLIENDFDTKKLGQLFIDLGAEIIKEKNKITNIELKSRFIEKVNGRGKEFDVVFEYDTIKSEKDKEEEE